MQKPEVAVSKVKCLVVDDLAGNLQALSAVLQFDDVEVLKANSGREALELLLQHEVALALLDVQMPEMDGFELAELMRGSERARHVPIIFVTAGSRNRPRLFKGYESGAVDFLYKPIEPHILKSKAEVFFQLDRQRRQLTADLQERTQTLRLNEMLMAVLGHDLRNPLSAVLTSAQLIQRMSGDEAVTRLAARIESSGKRMNRMIADLLDLARARLAGGIPLRREPTDLAKQVHGVVQEYQATSPANRIEIEELGDLRGFWDPERLAQVAANLIGNALTHGLPSAPVGVQLDGRRADLVILSVANAGAIPPEVAPHLFDPFRSGGQPTARTSGLGLGLYIVQQIVQAHGGSVRLEPTTDNRTIFRVEIHRGAANPTSGETI